jgi:hypothetical protein
MGVAEAAPMRTLPTSMIPDERPIAPLPRRSSHRDGIEGGRDRRIPTAPCTQIVALYRLHRGCPRLSSPARPPQPRDACHMGLVAMMTAGLPATSAARPRPPRRSQSAAHGGYQQAEIIGRLGADIHDYRGHSPDPTCLGEAREHARGGAPARTPAMLRFSALPRAGEQLECRSKPGRGVLKSMSAH